MATKTFSMTKSSESTKDFATVTKDMDLSDYLKPLRDKRSADLEKIRKGLKDLKDNYERSLAELTAKEDQVNHQYEIDENQWSIDFFKAKKKFMPEEKHEVIDDVIKGYESILRKMKK